MEKFHRLVMWIVLLLIILLVGFSIYGAFIGAEKAKEFFNSLPLISYWLILIFMLIVGFLNFPRLARTPSLLLIHFGCILIIAAGMYGSEAGHKARKNIFGVDKIYRGQMIIPQNHEIDIVKLENTDQIKLLPFLIKLKDFRIEYYGQGQTGTGAIRDFISSLAVIKDGKTIAQKDVEVNHPLHFGGYYFYQHSYDPKAARYTVLKVVSDSGLGAVYIGYLCLAAGVFWHFWLGQLFRKTENN
ncbi:MAG: cytochrome c biogenesis protein ResB [Sedimentisphaerales bacterium]|nr:cytochrome c biogenesis protein ResB [Sedimentisphaerales bacterium]